MKSMMKKYYELQNLNDKEKMNYFRAVYPNLNDDIIYYFLVRHLGTEFVYEEFSQLNLSKCYVEELELSNDQIFEIEYADFCSFKNETVQYYNILNVVAPNYFITGTWTGPILTTPRNNKLVAIDGNNRLRMLRCYLKHTNMPICDKHRIYVIRQND